MNDIFPTTVGGWVGLITTVIVGIFALVSLFDRTTANRRKEKDELDEGLISSLKATIEELTTRIEKMDLAQKENVATVNRLLGENNVMKALLQGRDDQTQAAQRASIETHAMMKTLTVTLTEFLKQHTK